jgi:hypothetical protein
MVLFVNKRRVTVRNTNRCNIQWICVYITLIYFVWYSFISILYVTLPQAATTLTTTTTSTTTSDFEMMTLVQQQQQQYHRKINHKDGHTKAKKKSNINSPHCLSHECIQRIAATIARRYPIRTNKSSWCSTSNDEEAEEGDGTRSSHTKENGIILIKVTKAASSTTAGVVIRIAKRHSCQQVQWKHRFRNEVQYDVEQSFIITTIREPASRAVSTVFFHALSRQHEWIPNFQITDKIVLNQLQTESHPHYGAISDGQGGFQLRYTYPKDTIPEYSAWNPDVPGTVVNGTDIIRYVQETIASYDFIIVPERMDESLVVLALLLQIDVSDVLVTSSKVAGATQYHMLHPNKTSFACIKTTKSYTTPVVTRFLQSNRWRAMNYGDYLLYEVAKQSLDVTIRDTIGIDRFNVALQRYRTLQQLEQLHCAPNVQFPCSNDGVPQLRIAKENCYLYYYDFGCGYPCIDTIIQQYDNGTLSQR